IAALPAERQRVALAGAGYIAPHWPEPYGLAASPAAQLTIDEELGRAGLTRPDLGIGRWAVPAILRHGTPAHRDRLPGPTPRREGARLVTRRGPGAAPRRCRPGPRSGHARSARRAGGRRARGIAAGPAGRPAPTGRARRRAARGGAQAGRCPAPAGGRRGRA